MLELRVHGVNNTTPAALLDLSPDEVRNVSGDKLGSFWEPTPAALKEEKRTRGFVPTGIRREAYSWGGMVRTTPNFGGSGSAGVIVGVLARIYYALLLPLSIGNAIQWTRNLQVTGPDEQSSWRSRLTASAARLFGLVLTLLYTTAAATIALDVVAAQCGSQPALCGPLEDFLTPIAAWSAGQRLAVFALAPVAAVFILWIVSSVSRARYDVLPGMEGNLGRVAHSSMPATGVLAQPGFWSNRMTRYLARAHLSATICLTMLFVTLDASLGWFTTCPPLVFWGDCVGDAWKSGWFTTCFVIAVVAFIGLIASAVIVCFLPTMKIATEEEIERAWPNRATFWLLFVVVPLFAATLLILAIGEWPEDLRGRLYGAERTPLVLVVAGGLLAFSGIFWRKREPAARRNSTAWRGTAPAVFMTLALATAVASSAIVVVMVGDFLNGTKGPAALLGEEPGEPTTPGRVSISWTDIRDGVTGTVEVGGPVPPEPGLVVSRTFVILGTLIFAALIVLVLALLVWFALVRLKITTRATAWATAPTARPQPDGGVLPPSGPGDIVIPPGGVLPPSSASLFKRIDQARGRAAMAHLAEPGVGLLAIILGLGLVTGIILTIVSYTWVGVPEPDTPTAAFLSVGMTCLAILGVLLVGVLAAGASSGGSRPLGIVWDIACYLPRTGHPFGPPCYAERAVPEIAGRLNRWLRDNDENRAILVAHSMGAVLSVSAIALLSSSDVTNARLHRVSLLTFGVQLRPYFGRMLPELLGPDALGTHVSLPPRAGKSGDPWEPDFTRETQLAIPPATPAAAAAAAAAAGTPVAAAAVGGGAAPSTDTAQAPLPSPPMGRIKGTIVPRDSDGNPVLVRWINLWRLSDYLGFPALSTAPSGVGWINDTDRIANELDKSGYMVEVGTHGEYYRVREYTFALEQLRDALKATP